MTTRYLRPLPAVLSVVLAACATAPAPKSKAPVAPAPAPQATHVIEHKPATTISMSPGTGENANIWEQLRSSFEMADCDADPNITAWAKRYTQNPQRFEDQMSEVAPRLAYVQQVAAKHNVAGEFALLPWVESQYRPVSGGKNMPAGMWQIMPATADAIGIRVDRNFDGRLDVPAATDAIMTLLSRYHDDLGDWRLVDYAFNAGEFGMRRMIDQHGAPPEQPVIPKMPVKPVTREHLIKLLAIACVIREPGRFNVSLPTLPSEQRLVAVNVSNSMPMSNAASHAGMAPNDLKQLNAGFRNGMIDTNAAAYLLMPSDRAQQFRSSILAGNDSDTQSVPGTAVLPPLGAVLNAATDDDADTGSKPAKGKRTAGTGKTQTHTVKAGESLWTIAKRYAVNIQQLEQWNHLAGPGVKPGQILKVSAPG